MGKIKMIKILKINICIVIILIMIKINIWDGSLWEIMDKIDKAVKNISKKKQIVYARHQEVPEETFLTFKNWV